MAATKKSAKGSRGKKRPAAKRSSSKKQSARKASAKRRTKKSLKAAALKRRARKGLRVARQAGKKTWKTLKSTTAEVIQGVKGTFGETG